jgi:hypothetical protein
MSSASILRRDFALVGVDAEQGHDLVGRADVVLERLQSQHIEIELGLSRDDRGTEIVDAPADLIELAGQRTGTQFELRS